MQQRRRGAELETVLLEAAWAELAEVGYARLTMEGVAARAGTGKQVLYRRWRNRAELVKAAMRHHTGSVADRVKDTGTLRGDVLAVLRQVVRRQREVGPEVLRGLMAEAYDLGPASLNVMHEVMVTILERASARGEIPTADVSRRVAMLPADLVRHEMLLTGHPVSTRTLTEIVDDIFLPLLDRQDLAKSLVSPLVQAQSGADDGDPGEGS